MTTYGLTDTGFVTKPLLAIKEEIEAALRTPISPEFDVSAESPEGQVIGIIAERVAELWELAEALYRSLDPDNTTGDAQDSLCALTGTMRQAAESSTVSATLIGTSGATIPKGSGATVGTGGARFSTTAAVTLGAITAWAATHGYAVGSVCTNDTGKAYLCITAGTSAGSGGPTGTSTDITDGSVHWRYLAAGTYYANASFASDDEGAIAADAYSLNTIVTPVSGWVKVCNGLDAELGRTAESNAALRLRREQLLRMTGSGALDAIRADVADVADVDSCTVFENTGDIIDADGVPPHAIEVLAQGGTDAAIAAAIWGSKPAGIATHGDDFEMVEDSQGDNHTVYFSRPIIKDIYLVIDVTTDADFPSDGETQIKDALVAHGAIMGLGKDVIRAALFEHVFAISGVVDVTNIKLGFSAAPAGTVNLTIGSRELADFDTARITVNVA